MSLWMYIFLSWTRNVFLVCLSNTYSHTDREREKRERKIETQCSSPTHLSLTPYKLTWGLKQQPQHRHHRRQHPRSRGCTLCRHAIHHRYGDMVVLTPGQPPHPAHTPGGQLCLCCGSDRRCNYHSGNWTQSFRRMKWRSCAYLPSSFSQQFSPRHSPLPPARRCQGPQLSSGRCRSGHSFQDGVSLL